MKAKLWISSDVDGTYMWTEKPYLFQLSGGRSIYITYEGECIKISDSKDAYTKPKKVTIVIDENISSR